MGTAIVAGTIREATPPRTCTLEESCPEPEQKPVDLEAHGRPSGPTGPTESPYRTTGPTGPIMGTAAIIEGSDTASGTVTLNLPSAVTVIQS